MLPTTPNDWVFYATALQEEARSSSWPDHELLDMFTYGCYDCSPDTTPVSWFAPHSASVYKQWPDFAASVRKEINLGWMEGPWNHIPTVPFRVVPGASIPKPRQPGTFRTKWNASIPGPHLSKSVVDTGNNQSLSVASNAVPVLPHYLAISWLSIERVCLHLHILASAAATTGESIWGRS